MRLALDTNRYIDAMRGQADVVTAIETAHAVVLPFPSLAELHCGFIGHSRGTKGQQLLREFLSRPGVSILFADERTTQEYARLYLQLRRQGTPIPTNDIWIAALVVQHNLVLATRDRHFERLPQVPRL